LSLAITVSGVPFGAQIPLQLPSTSFPKFESYQAA
jgi:hypothetical protein